MKMLWDDEYLYVAAILESTFEVVASFTERNSPIFQLDSDFEVFIDAAGSCDAYKELELNAKNVVWNLLLTRPYADGGGEHSGRVAAPGAADYYEVANQRTATRLLSGQLGDPAGATWAVEMALAHSDTLVRQPNAPVPRVGARWRINFSRVEKRGAINWTWGPQVVWEPRSGRYEGKVNMHLPDAWGFVEFASAEEAQPGESEAAAAAVAAAPRAVAERAAMVGYYAMHAFRERGGGFATSLDALRAASLLDESVLADCDLAIAVDEGQGAATFVLTATHRASGTAVRVNEVRLVVGNGAQQGSGTCGEQ